MLVFYFVALSVKKLSVDKFYAYLDLLSRIQSLNAEIYVLSKDEGGRHTPFFQGYRPQFYFRTTDVTGACELPEGVEMVMPGDNVKMKVELITPIAMEEGLTFRDSRRWPYSRRRCCS